MTLCRLILFVALACLSVPGNALAYVGPGAGIALAGSYLPALAGIAATVLLLLLWPIRLFFKARMTQKALKNNQMKKCVILGLDGLDPELTRDYMDQGLLPNFSRLAHQGCFKKLSTTTPAISPVAWSSFQTGSNPGKHGIFDFLAREKSSYQPVLSSVRTQSFTKHVRFGKFRIPTGRSQQRLLRKGRPFWEILGEHNIFSQVIRVPVTFPPQKFHGAILAGAYAPDIRGSQGIFSYFHTGPMDTSHVTGGEFYRVKLVDKTIQGFLSGPPNPFEKTSGDLQTPFTVSLLANGKIRLKVGKISRYLEQGKYSPWVRVRFKAAPGIFLHGVCKFLITSVTPEFAMYVTPIHMDPNRPAMPISHPRSYAAYFSKKVGPYATLGMAEDTWALEEGVLDEKSFMDQCLCTEQEREKIFLEALKRSRHGLVACVFDGPDRIQHCYWKDQDDRASRKNDPESSPIKAMYIRMDNLVGKTLEHCQKKGTVFMVLSDHGFAPFTHAVDLNKWLEENGYLKLLDNPSSNQHLSAIDWEHTRAYAMGMAGISLNIKDREPRGFVEPDKEADRLAREIACKLTGLCLPENNAKAVSNVYLARDIYTGPYSTEGPDLVVGYARGFRTSWDTVTGKVGAGVFQQNNRAWSGDHCMDPPLVPGVFFCNRPITADQPHIMDIGPTVLNMFGVSVPSYMDGKPLRTAKTNEDQAQWRSFSKV
ncbi:MAG: alkaline phosphatase family protein [Desulfatibacillum sp.]|nr:alkaline phosphatase family protein [Desulfatibacillum sp.]